MLIKKPSDIKSAEITRRDIYMNRRHFIWAAAMIRRWAKPSYPSRSGKAYDPVSRIISIAIKMLN